MLSKRRIQPEVTELKLTPHCELTADDVQQVLSASCLTSLRANAHYFSKETVAQFLALPLLKLHLEGYEVLPSLTTQSTLTSLTLDFCYVPAEILDAVVKGNPLTSLDVTFSTGFTHDLRAISEKSTLTSVDLSGNSRPEYAAFLPETTRLLCLNTSITVLKLSNNHLTDEAVAILAHNTNLRVLSCDAVSSNRVTALLGNTSLERLRINKFPVHASVPFDTNTTLQRLEISTSDPLSCENVRALANNTTLTHLSANIDYGGCQILEAGNISLISLLNYDPLGVRMYTIYHHVARNRRRKLRRTAMLISICLCVRRAYN